LSWKFELSWTPKSSKIEDLADSSTPQTTRPEQVKRAWPPALMKSLNSAWSQSLHKIVKISNKRDKTSEV
jgi:hypothetical protein